MKFVAEGLVLSESAMTVSKACAVRTLNPALECIKIAAKNDSLVMTAYDGEISIEKKIRADVLEEGEILVNGKYFTDFLNKITDKTVTVATGERGVEILYDDSRSFIQSLPATDFPFVRKDDTTDCFEIKEEAFKSLISKTIFCCATDDSRPILKGCLLEKNGDKLYATALDGFRMAVSECAVEGGSDSKIVCPARTLNEISRMTEGDDKILKINFSKNTLSVSFEDTVLLSRLYIGEFVKKDNIFPPQFTTELYVRKEELCDSIERAAVLTRGDKNNLIVLDIKNGSVGISANSEMGNLSETVAGELHGKELKIAMNGKYVADALKVIDGEFVKMSFNSGVSPFTIENKEKKESSYLILPVRTTA